MGRCAEVLQRIARHLQFDKGQQQESFLVLLLFVLSLGIFVAAEVPFGAPKTLLAVLFVLLLAGSAMLVWREHRLAFLPLVLLFFVLGAFRYTTAVELPSNDISSFARQEVHVVGRLSEAPRFTEDNEGQVKVRYAIDVMSVRVRGEETRAASGGCYIYSRPAEGQTIPDVQIGDVIEASGKVRLPHGYQNPGQLDTELLLRVQGIAASVAVGKGGVKVTSEAQPTLVMRFHRQIAAIREHYAASMQNVMPERDAAAIFAMLFGGYDGIDPQLLIQFTTTGIVHILSVSGSHISLLAAVLAWLGGVLRLPRPVTAVLVVCSITIYTFLAGCVPPVVRSAIMGGLTFFALALGRERDARRLLSIVGLIMLLVWPLLLFHISFQLSFLATAGLLYLSPRLAQWFQERGLPRLLAGSFALSISAQGATLPVIAYYFNQLSISCLLANLIVVPIVELMIVFGLFAGLVGWLIAPIGKVVFVLDSLLLGLVRELTRVLAALPGSMIWVPTPGGAACIAYYAGLGALLQSEERKKAELAFLVARRKPVGAVFVAVLVFLAAAHLAKPNEMAVHFIDVGQGDAALIVTPHGHAFLVDTGGTRDGAFDIGARVDVPYLLHYGVHRVDAIFFSHAHEDHAAGAGSILLNLPVQHLFTASEGREAYAKSMRLSTADPQLAKFTVLRTGDRYTIDGVTIDVIDAPADGAEKGENGNEACDVVRVSYGGASFLFTGDMAKEQEAQLLDAGRDVAATVLKVGHHGSDTSSSEPFLRAVAPRYGVISVGYDNSYGHPKQTILDRLASLGIETLRTDEQGAIVFHTDGERMRVETYAQTHRNVATRK